MEEQILKFFEENPEDYFSSAFTEKLYPFFFRCNVVHSITNAYEHLLRSIIYSEGKGLTKKAREDMGMYGHNLEKKVRHISSETIEKFDNNIKIWLQDLQHIQNAMEISDQSQTLEHISEDINSLEKLAKYIWQNQKLTDVRYMYEYKKVSIMPSFGAMAVSIVLSSILSAQHVILLEYPIYRRENVYKKILLPFFNFKEKVGSGSRGELSFTFL